MLLAESQVHSIAERLLQKSRAHQVVWNLLGDNSFYVVLPNGVLACLQQFPEGQFGFVLSYSPTTVIGEIKSGPQQPGHVDLSQLFSSAKEYLSNNTTVSILEALQNPGTVGRPIMSSGTTTTTTLPPRPMIAQQPFPFEAVFPVQPLFQSGAASSLLPAQSQVFFAKIAGKWRLDYGRGTEDACIDKDGNYYVGNAQTPTFVLDLLASNEDMTHVELAKNKALPDGRRYQIEVLRVSDNEMRGEAKHDRHQLHYVRNKGHYAH